MAKNKPKGINKNKTYHSWDILESWITIEDMFDCWMLFHYPIPSVPEWLLHGLEDLPSVFTACSSAEENQLLLFHLGNFFKMSMRALQGLCNNNQILWLH